MSEFLDYPDPIPTGAAQLAGLANHLAFRFLDGHPEPFTSPAPILSMAARLDWVRIDGVGRIDGLAPRALPVPLLGGIGPTRTPLAALLSLKQGHVTAAFGRPGGAPELATIGGLLHSPSCSALPNPLAHTAGWSWACLFGWPGHQPDTSSHPSPVDLLLDGFWGAELVWLVLATPEPISDLDTLVTRLETATGGIDRAHVKVGLQPEVDRAAIDLRTQLEAALRRVRRGRSEGMWRASLLVGSPDQAVARHAAALLAASWCAPDGSEGVPLRAFGAGSGRYNTNSNTLLVEELTRFCALPTRDRAGYAVHDVATFDVDHPAIGGIALGTVLDGERDTHCPFTIASATLCRHLLVAGQTGSGKSTTVRTLLAGVARLGIPFLVLDPVKPASAEYASLATLVPGLRVLRVGAMPGPEDVPLLLNPLAFPIGYPLFTHLDLLKATFTAAFGLFPPLPYLLEAALHRVYALHGWDPATGEHPRPGDRLAIPTLSELLKEIDAVFDAAAYAGEADANLRAALRARLASLCAGPRGICLDTRDDLPDSFLFASPIVVELMHVGSPEEQAFIMGLVLMRLFEVRQAGGLPATDALRHLVVIEEAHRLLKEAPRRGSEDASPAAQAVETICNLLAEIRAYGQGIVIAEQLPTTLATQVARQSSLKILHRLTPKEDREAMAAAMVLTGEQTRSVATFPTGRAAVYGEGMNGAVCVQVAPLRPAAPQASLALPADVHMLVVRRRARARVATALRALEVRRAVSAAWLASVQDRPLPTVLDPVRVAIRRALRNVSAPSSDAAVEAVLVEALEDALLARAVHYRMSDAAYARARAGIASPQAFLESLAGRTFRRQGPTWWCEACPTPCRYGYEGNAIGTETDFRTDIERVFLEAPADRPAAISEALDLSRDTHMHDLPTFASGMRYCAVAHALDTLPLTRRTVTRTLTSIR